MARILIIDDDRDFLKVMEVYLRDFNHKVATLTKGDRVIEEIDDFKPDLIITDIMMPGITGGAIYSTIRQKIGRDLPLIVCSATKMRLHYPRDLLLDHCPKPVDFPLLTKAIDRLLSLAKRQTQETVDEEGDTERN
jgi:CheY-like chemotaxis protein